MANAFAYLWNITHWATVTYEVLAIVWLFVWRGAGGKREQLTMLSWVSFRAESFAKTASSVYAILE